MNFDKCPGKYDNLHGEWGKVIRRECISCLRRTATGKPIEVPEFIIHCIKKVS